MSRDSLNEKAPAMSCDWRAGRRRNQAGTVPKWLDTMLEAPMKVWNTLTQRLPQGVRNPAASPGTKIAKVMPRAATSGHTRLDWSGSGLEAC